MNPWPKNIFLRALAFAASLPTHTVAAVLAMLAWPIAWWSVSIQCGVVEFVSHGPLGRWFFAHNWAGVTLGASRFLWVTPDNRIRSHEARHSRQALLLGPLFGPCYLFLLLGCAYADHPLEIDATAHEIP